MKKKSKLISIVIIILIAGFLRFFNLMHDSPYFFNPDERNMANAISQFKLPANFFEIPNCLINQFIQPLTTNQQLITDCNLNPHFFSYGQFPLYLAYASDQIIDQIIRAPLVLSRPPLADLQEVVLQTSFSSAILWLRFWSALSSVLTVLFVYLISHKLFAFHFSPARNASSITDAGGLFAAAAAAFTPGLIQSAHFGTTESILTFFFMAAVYLSLKLLTNPLSLRNDIILLSLVIGLALGSKLTGIFFFIPPLIALKILFIRILKKKKNNWFFVTLFHCFIVSLLIFGSILIFIISSPYNLVEPESFKSAVFGYESDVATGRYEAFYTRQFVNTSPIFFQSEKIFPYVLGWPVFILGSMGILLITFKLLLSLILLIIQKVQSSKFKVQKFRIKKYSDFDHLDLLGILILGFWIFFIPNASLFAKWTRFMTPILPLFSIFAGYFLSVILGSVSDSRIFKLTKLRDSGQARMTKKFGYLFICLLIIISILPGLMFMSIYTREDTRVTASKWIYQNIPNKSYILSETANVVDIPLGIPNYQLPITNYQIISFDFYHLDENPQLFRQLLNHLEKSDYIFIPSRRIFANYTKIPQKFPLVTKYYQLLFSGALGFEKVSEISSFPQLSINNYQLTIPDENSEETFTVFDHPVIRIYRKIKPMTIDDYRFLFSRSMSLLRSFESLS